MTYPGSQWINNTRGSPNDLARQAMDQEHKKIKKSTGGNLELVN